MSNRFKPAILRAMKKLHLNMTGSDYAFLIATDYRIHGQWVKDW
jgi:hypothetical protein